MPLNRIQRGNYLPIMRHGVGLLALLCIVMPRHALAVDLDSLESAASSQLCQGDACRTDCDNALTQRIGRDLPVDADDCHAHEQYQLLGKGLYRTRTGEVLSLKHGFQPVASQQNIDVPKIQQQQVSDKDSPYVIDLQSNIQVRSPSAGLSPRKQQAHAHPVVEPRLVITAAHAEPVQHKLETRKQTETLKLGCRSLSTFGHRGGPSAPENSIPAVLSGLKDRHNGVEIDTQRLSDGVWVVHHDPMIGRSSYGANGFVNLLSSADWKQVYLLGRNGGQTRVKAPLLNDLLQAFRQHAVKGQVINIEIKMVRKGQYSCAQLAALYQQVRSILEPSQFLFTSTYLDALQCMRNVNHGVYLGLIIEPNDESLKRIINTSYGAEFRSFKQHVPGWLQKKLQKKHENNRSWLSHDNYVDLADMIGPSYGLHIDYRDIDQIAKKMKASGGRWMIYELNDDQGMLEMLQNRIAQHQSMPLAIIIDAPRETFCRAL